MNKVLITGGAGYIGSVLTEIVLNAGHEVTVLDNYFFKQKSLIGRMFDRKLNIVKGDVRDEKLLEELVPKHDIIVPLACLVGMPLCNRYPQEAKQVNFEQIYNISKLSSKDQLIIYPTTNSGYGVGQRVEGKSIECTEETPLNPISLYGKLKANAEYVLLNNDKNNSVSFRLATVFGVSPRMRLDLLVNDFTYRACRDKYIVLFEANFKRNYIHVRDVANCFFGTMINPSGRTGQVFNLGLSSANLSKLELCETIKKFVPDFYITTSEINKDPDQRDYIVSNKKLEDTGWVPRYTLEDGIQEIIRAYPLLSIPTDTTNV